MRLDIKTHYLIFSDRLVMMAFPNVNMTTYIVREKRVFTVVLAEAVSGNCLEVRKS